MLPISIYNFADVNHIPAISCSDGSCDNPSLRSAADCLSLGYPDCNGIFDSLFQESQDVNFFC